MRQLMADKLVGGRVPALSTHWRARAIPSSHLVHRFGADIAEKIRQITCSSTAVKMLKSIWQLSARTS
jgi:hypothetical protein